MKAPVVPPVDDETPPLVFQWERRSRVHWRLMSLVALSLLIHAVGFYVLQVSYTPTGSQLPPPVQVTMARPERPDDPPELRAQSRALAHWLTVIDPSLATQPTTPGNDRPASASLQYIPSYKAAPPPFKPLDPPSAGSAAPPPPRPPGPVPFFSSHVGTQAAKPSPTTLVHLTGNVAPLISMPMPAVTLTLPAGTKMLGTTIFLVGVRSDGGAPFLFRETSSGEVSADDFAQDYLSRLRFQPPVAGSGATVWGWAEFNWGREIYR